MIARRVKLQVLAFLVISVLGVTYVGLRYVGFGLVKDTYTVKADFAESGGIFTGAEVTYRGVTVGSVGPLHLNRDGVRVELVLNSGSKVPSGTRAVVADRSAVGEQYVDLQPDTAHGPYLQAGSVIPRSRTSTPLAVHTLLLNLDRLVNSVDRKDLTTVIDELGKAFAGAGPDLQRLIDGGDALLTDAQANLEQTIALLRDGRTVLSTQRDSSAEIKRWAVGLASLSDQLRRSDPDIRKLLGDGPGAAGELQSLLTGLRPTLGTLLANLIVVGQVQGRRLPGLEQILVTYPPAVNSGFSVLQYSPQTRQWTAHFGLQLSLDPDACQQGYAKQHSAARPAPPGNCTRAEVAAGAGTRSARTAPRPAGAQPGLPAGAAGGPPAGAVAAAGQAGSVGQAGAGQPIPGAGGSVPGAEDLWGVAAPGSTGGQQRLMGDQSWKWLLLGPLTT